jgi:phospholipase C
VTSLPLRRLPRSRRRRRSQLSRRRALQGLGALVGAAGLAACADDGTAADDEDGSETGDGDGDPSTGDGDGDPTTGDGDGDPSTGDGDGDSYASCNTSTLSPEQLLAGIDHIVVVMMENRSFDHMLGALSLVEGLPVDGLSGAEQNPTLDGQPVPIFPTDLYVHDEDPPHGWNSCHAQFNAGANDGFVREHQLDGAQDYAEVMGYYLREQLPVYHALIDEYVLCDRWFSSVMSSTWPNRFYLHCATSDGTQGNDAISGVPSLFDQLAEAEISAGYYASGLPVVITYGTPLSAPHVKVIQDFFAEAEAGTLPSFSIVDPVLTAGATIGNDDHPPADVRDGQAFIASIYDALANSPQWDRCLLVVIYDEHGGFYDHVPPPLTTDEHPGFEQLGFRIPAIVVGPQVHRGCVNGTVFDHVAVAATVAKRWGLEPLNARVAAAADLSSCIDPEAIANPRPPIPLPQLTVARAAETHVPGADYGGPTGPRPGSSARSPRRRSCARGRASAA